MRKFFSGGSRGWSYDNDDGSPTERMALTHFQSLEGAVLEYYGADAGDHTFKVDDIVFKVLEDPDDGYRSHLGAIDYTQAHDSIFFRTPVARVMIETYDSGHDPDESQDEDDPFGGVKQGYRLVDVDDGHVWLEFGTDNYDDYYPYFVFRHQPKSVPLKVPMSDYRG